MKKAYLEIVELEVADVVTASPPCGEYIPVIPTECQDPDFD